MPRKIFLIGLVILLALSPLAASSETLYVVVGSSNFANVREEPNKKSKITATFERGKVLELPDDFTIQNDFVEIEDGWIYYFLLSVDPPYTGVNGKIDSKARVALRENPGGKVINWLQSKAKFSVISKIFYEDSYWYQVKHKKTKGWVKEEFVVLDESEEVNFLEE